MQEIDGHTHLYGFFAHPATHSLSPLMHNLSFEHHGINARYFAFDVMSNQLADAITSIRAMKLLGANLSMPLKQEVLPLLDELTPRAQQLQTVNVIKNEDGKLIGDTVDGEGFMANLRAQGIPLKGRTITVLGAGGAGMSIIQAAIHAQVEQVIVFKRYDSKFNSIAEQLQKMSAGFPTEVMLIDYHDTVKMTLAVQNSHILINATNLGMGINQDKLPAPPEVLAHLNKTQTVCDVIYVPRETRLLTLAKAQGCRTIDGLGMLIYQGALSFQWWTGKEMPLDLVIPRLTTQIKQPIESRN